MSEKRSNLINVGRVSGPYGVKGWLKVVSNTEPKENIVNYSPWWLKTQHGVKALEVDDYRVRNDALVVHFKGVDDRDLAAQYHLVDVAVERSQLPVLEKGDYYWHELIGLEVVSEFDGQQVILGNVKQLMETGANDVLIVAPSDSSVDDRERLVPYIPDVYVTDVSVVERTIIVTWDPDF